MGDATTSSLEPKTAEAHAPDTPPPPTQEEALVDIEEIYYSSSASKSLEYDFSRIQKARIHRFPHHLMGIGGDDKRYVVPSVVAIGPYHRGLPHLQEMEEIKKAVTNKVCGSFCLSLVDVHKRILTLASDARRCYDVSAVADLSDGEFTAMMVVDACFLLWFMAGKIDDPLKVGCILSFGPRIANDMLLLDNQIPWLVLDILITEFMGLRREDVLAFIQGLADAGFRSAPNPKTATIVFRNGRIDENCDFAADILARTAAQHYETPHHLLDHLWAVLRCNLMPPHNKGENELMRPRKSRPISAVELMHAGFKLTASTAGWFAYMKCQKKKLYFTGELSLSPLILGETMACRLVNLAALESVQATNSVDWDVDGYIVSSYLFMLAMLIIGEEDVHELRKSGILISNFSDAQTLAFFKGIRQHLRAGYLFLNTVDEIHECLRKRKVSIAIRKFVYNNYKTFVTVLSIAGVLIGVFKALYSLKKP